MLCSYFSGFGLNNNLCMLLSNLTPSCNGLLPSCLISINVMLPLSAPIARRCSKLVFQATDDNWASYFLRIP